MSKQYLDENGLAYLWEKVKNLASGKVDKENGKVLSSNDYTSTEKTKLAGIASGAQVNVIEGIQIGGDAVTLTNKIGNIPVMGAASSSAVGTKGVVPAPASGDQGKFLRGDATWQSISEGEVNQNAFSNIKVGSTTIAAEAKTDTLEIVAGSNITLTPDATNDKLTIAATDTTYTPASATPNMDGTGAVGTSAKYAREDHVHPTDTSRASASDLEELIDTVDALVDTSVDGVTLGSADNIHYGVCSTAAATGAKEVACPNFKLITGSRISVKFANSNTAATSSITLNVNNTGAKSIVYHGGSLPAYATLAAGTVYDFVYNGTSYELVGDLNRAIELFSTLYDSSVRIGFRVDGLNSDISYVSISDASTSKAGVMSKADKTKLNGIATGAEVNQNAFSNVTIGSTTIAADSKTDTLEFVAGSNVTLTPDATNDKITIAATDTTYSEATTSAAGLLSASDKTKLNKLIFDSSNKIDSSILPSYVDDVIESYARSGQTELSSTWLATGSASGTVITPETGKIYILMADSGDYSANDQFRWSGTTYVKLSDGGVSAITNAEIDTICV